MKNLFFAFAVAVATLLSGVSAQAGYLNGSAGFTMDLTPGSGTLTTPQNASNVIKQSGGSLDFANALIPAGTAWGDFAISSPISSTLSISNGTFGTFVASSAVDNISGSFRLITLTGLFTPGSLFAGGSLVTPATINMTLNETGGTITGSFTMAMNPPPPAAVPEPASMAIFGLGALGIAARRFRRK